MVHDQNTYSSITTVVHKGSPNFRVFTLVNNIAVHYSMFVFMKHWCRSKVTVMYP